jgi:signal recognition particle subunit SEC65
MLAPFSVALATETRQTRPTTSRKKRRKILFDICIRKPLYKELLSVLPHLRCYLAIQEPRTVKKARNDKLITKIPSRLQQG